MASPPLLFNIIPKTGIRHRPQNLPNHPVLNNIAHLDTQREKPCPNSLHQEKTLLPRSINQNPRLRRINRKRLFTEHVLAGVQG
jgi:hypothetical protein